jgi:hypothetical protein
LHLTFEEGTSAAWLYDLLKPHVTKLLVCDPRKNASMREVSGNAWSYLRLVVCGFLGLSERA